MLTEEINSFFPDSFAIYLVNVCDSSSHFFALAAYILFIFTSPQVSKSFFPYIEEILKYFLFILFPLFLGSDSFFFF